MRPSDFCMGQQKIFLGEEVCASDSLIEESGEGRRGKENEAKKKYARGKPIAHAIGLLSCARMVAAAAI